MRTMPKIRRKLQTLYDVGLGYIKIGQPATTLSGGEAQRVKLATELSKRHTGRTIYILDEPTTGLHVADVHKLIDVLEAPGGCRQYRGGHRAQPGCRSKLPTTSSTWGPRAATEAAKWWPAARPSR